jgi:hypothetical protein
LLFCAQKVVVGFRRSSLTLFHFNSLTCSTTTPSMSAEVALRAAEVNVRFLCLVLHSWL